MPKSIRVDEPTYNRLAGLLRPRETFNDVVSRLLIVHDKSNELLDALEGSIKFQVEKSERLHRVSSLDAAYTARDDAQRYIDEHTKE